MDRQNPHTKPIRFDEIEPKDPDFLWFPYIRGANLNILAADGGSGKTTLAFSVIAAPSKGCAPVGMPGELRITEPTNSVYLGGEDEPATYAGMLDRFGADRGRVFTIDYEHAPQISDTARIEALIREANARLLVIDPIQAFTRAGTDMNQASAVRPQLEALRTACKRTGCAALLLAHFNKAAGMLQKASYRTAGSTDFINACRSSLSILQHPRDSSMRIVFHSKANFAHGEPFAFSINENGFIWHGTCTEFSESECLSASDRHIQVDFENTKSRSVIRLIESIMIDRQVWSGTCQKMLEAVPDFKMDTNDRALGRMLASLQNELYAKGLLVRRKSDKSRIWEIRRVDTNGGADGE